MPTRRQRSSMAGEEENATKKARSGVAVGDMIPDIELETDESTAENKKTINLKRVAEETGLVLFFYPKASTPGCTKQACGFRDYYKDLLNKGYQVFGMSADKPKAQANWKNKQDLPFPLLCDTSFEFMKAIGIMKGPKSIKRSHIIVDKGGAISAIEISISPQKSVDLAVEKIIGDVEDEEEMEKEKEEVEQKQEEQQVQQQEQEQEQEYVMVDQEQDKEKEQKQEEQQVQQQEPEQMQVDQEQDKKKEEEEEEKEKKVEQQQQQVKEDKEEVQGNGVELKEKEEEQTAVEQNADTEKDAEKVEEIAEEKAVDKQDVQTNAVQQKEETAGEAEKKEEVVGKEAEKEKQATDGNQVVDENTTQNAVVDQAQKTTCGEGKPADDAPPPPPTSDQTKETVKEQEIVVEGDQKEDGTQAAAGIQS